MRLKLFMNLERHAFYIVMLSIVGILWYMCLWGIFDESIEYIHKKYKYSKRLIYSVIIACILVTILVHPEVLDIL